MGQPQKKEEGRFIMPGNLLRHKRLKRNMMNSELRTKDGKEFGGGHEKNMVSLNKKRADILESKKTGKTIENWR